MDILTIITILIFASFLWPVLQNKLAVARRLALIKQIESIRKSRVITMIHRQETLSLFGIPLTRYIDIEDSEQVLRAIHLTPDSMPIDLILHTPGGLFLASEQIANAGRKQLTSERPMNPVLVLTGNELFSDFGPPYCWDGKPYRKKFEHIFGLLEIANATQQIYLDLPPWEDEWYKKIEERRKKFQANASKSK